MNYCIECHLLTDGPRCPRCGSSHLQSVHRGDYCYVAELDEMRAKMFEEVLVSQGIFCLTLPIFGAAMTLRGGCQERLRIYVPYTSLERASTLYRELFAQA